DVVSCIYEDQEGNLWIGTRNGLDRWKDGKFRIYTTRDGLFDDTVFQILEDDKKNLWMSSNRGIFRVAKKDLDDFDRKAIAYIGSISYGPDDGMKSSECNAGKPGGWKTRDGKLWFATMRGLVVVDPNHLPANALRPPVYIEEMLADNNPFHETGGHKLQLAPGKERIEFHYTALSFVSPDKVRFKYRLDGFDPGWIEAGTRRVAFYTHLPPGAYTFNVMA